MEKHRATAWEEAVEPKMDGLESACSPDNDERSDHVCHKAGISLNKASSQRKGHHQSVA